MKTLLLTKDDVAQVVSMKDAIEAVEEGYKAFNSGNVMQPDFIAMPFEAPRGELDFKAFAASGNSSKTTVRTIFDIYVKREGEFVVITVTGDGFLYNMIRIMAGTLMLAGTGKLDFDGLLKIIESRDRTKAGKTAGPNGLTLMEINY